MVRAVLTARTDHTAIQDGMEAMAAMGLMVLMAVTEDQASHAISFERKIRATGVCFDQSSRSNTAV
jgi:hypothetical protein